MTDITICLVYFKSLALANLEAALYSVRRQNLSRVNSIVVFDNDTPDTTKSILQVIEKTEFQGPVDFTSFKHKDLTKTHAWSTNAAVERACTSWVFFTRADYVLDFSILEQFIKIADSKPEDWHGMITSYGQHLNEDIIRFNAMGWRDGFPTFNGAVIDYSAIDSGVWMMPHKSFDLVGGLDERLTAWGHAQTQFQWKLHQSGAEFVVVPKILFYHPQHGAPRDLDLANRQIAEIGVDLREMWARSPVKVY